MTPDQIFFLKGSESCLYYPTVTNQPMKQSSYCSYGRQGLSGQPHRSLSGQVLRRFFLNYLREWRFRERKETTLDVPSLLFHLAL